MANQNTLHYIVYFMILHSFDRKGLLIFRFGEKLQMFPVNREISFIMFGTKTVWLL